MQRNIWLAAISVIVVIILLNNSAYYLLTKRVLEQSLRKEMASVAGQIELSLEQSRHGSILFEDQIGRELRAASIAARYALDPDVEKVTNRQLEELSGKLGVSHITLMKRTEGDIVLYKSSDPNEIGQGTKNMKPWFDIFNQLFDRQAVTSGWIGQTLPNFWTGPYETATTDVDSINKWGYCYDGTTNYIIDPFVGYDRLKRYEDITGVSRLIGETLKRNDSLKEISILNPHTFGKGKIETINENGEKRVHILQQPVAYGSYRYKADDDAKLVAEAYATGETVAKEMRIGGERLYKMFIPVKIKNDLLKMTDQNGNKMDSYVLALVSDYGMIQNELNKQFLNMGLIIIAITFLSIVIAVGFMKVYKHSKEKAVRDTQSAYAEEMNQMFLAIRGQRHDFINHVQTIHALAELNKTEELVAYTKELTGEIRAVNDIIHIGNPAVAALVRSKISQAETFKIRFICSFEGLEQLEMGTRTFDLNRVIGNLIDNAFDEVRKMPEEEREVGISGIRREGRLELRVSNRCRDAESVAAAPVFCPGYTTKEDGHQGLGLSIVQSIVDGYKGEIAVRAVSEHTLEFVVYIPL
ncbi:sensor histidine kinase [Paenibacillus thailandensis]|uniref:Sensor histidine kinase n=1 Tax=Paenibacillus thailandensis TaxID=393250 RepID=A0ABW5R2V7_9BACL